MALTLAVFMAGLQIYFGVSLPAWINLPLFGLLGTVCLADPRKPRMVLAYAGGLALIAAVVLLLAPGVHEATELASEQVRDRLSLAEPWTATLTETPPDVLETRRENRVTLDFGAQEGQSSRDYRLMTVKQLDISRPAWVDYVRIVVLSLLILLLLTVPFLPFLWLNSRKKKAQSRRADFASEDHAVAIRALFRHVIAYLDFVGFAVEHQPFSQWEDALARHFSAAYAAQFVECARIWQETVYSDHTPNMGAASGHAVPADGDGTPDIRARLCRRQIPYALFRLSARVKGGAMKRATLCLLLACTLLLTGCRTRITAADRAKPSPLPASEGSERAVSNSTFSDAEPRPADEVEAEADTTENPQALHREYDENADAEVVSNAERLVKQAGEGQGAALSAEEQAAKRTTQIQSDAAQTVTQTISAEEADRLGVSDEAPAAESTADLLLHGTASGPASQSL